MLRPMQAPMIARALTVITIFRRALKEGATAGIETGMDLLLKEFYSIVSLFIPNSCLDILMFIFGQHKLVKLFMTCGPILNNRRKINIYV
jgi:uncharacterized membrane-anchored protein YitT (DUF2179 family)